MSLLARRLISNKNALLRLKSSSYATRMGVAYYETKCRVISVFLLWGNYHA